MLQLLSVPLSNGIRFFQHPLPAKPSAFLADPPASTRRRPVGFMMFGCDDMDELAPAYTPAALDAWSRFSLGSVLHNSSFCPPSSRDVIRVLSRVGFHKFFLSSSSSQVHHPRTSGIWSNGSDSIIL
jgi:hypothetical protein